MNAADPSVHLELRWRARRAAVLAAVLAGGIGACAHGPVQRERPPFPRGALDAAEGVTIAAQRPEERFIYGALRLGDPGELAKLGEGFGGALRDAIVEAARRAGVANVHAGPDASAEEATEPPATAEVARGARVVVGATWAHFVEAPGSDPYLALSIDLRVRIDLPPSRTAGRGKATSSVHELTLVDLEPRAASAWAADGGRAIADAEARLVERAARRIAGDLLSSAGVEVAAASAPEPERRAPSIPPESSATAAGADAPAGVLVSSSYEGAASEARGSGGGGHGAGSGAAVGLLYGVRAGFEASAACTFLFPVCAVIFVPTGAAAGTVIGAIAGGISAAAAGPSQTSAAIAPEPLRSRVRGSLRGISSDPALAARIQEAARTAAERAGVPAVEVTAIDLHLRGESLQGHPATPLLTVRARRPGAPGDERTVTVEGLGPLGAHLWVDDEAVLLRAAVAEAADRSGEELVRAFLEPSPSQPAGPPPLNPSPGWEAADAAH